MNKSIIIPFLFFAFSFNQVIREPVILDGKIDENEWANATKYNLSDGGNLYVLHEKDILYFGIKGNSPGWAHVYLYWNDSVRVLHASAALGEQLYINEKGFWKLQRNFSWELRESDYGVKLIQKQALYYAKNGWCANNNNTGDKITLEYKIDLKRFGTPEIKFAVLFTSDGKNKSHYPTKLNDDTLLDKLVSGTNPDSLHFMPQTWVNIKK